MVRPDRPAALLWIKRLHTPVWAFFAGCLLALSWPPGKAGTGSPPG